MSAGTTSILNHLNGEMGTPPVSTLGRTAKSHDETSESQAPASRHQEAPSAAPFYLIPPCVGLFEKSLYLAYLRLSKPCCIRDTER
ncbi:hypothetical protein D3C84_36650 [compost metagenome]